MKTVILALYHTHLTRLQKTAFFGGLMRGNWSEQVQISNPFYGIRVAVADRGETLIGAM